MGLDMYLNRVHKPMIKNEAQLNFKTVRSLDRDVIFLSEEEEPFCKTIINHSVPCYIEEISYDLSGMIREAFRLCGADCTILATFQTKLVENGRSYCSSENNFCYNSEDNNLSNFIDQHTGEYTLEELFNEDGKLIWRITCVLKEKGCVSIHIFSDVDLFPNEHGSCFLLSEWKKKRAIVMEEIDYQRKGLNDAGWDLLPGNCEFCDEKERIQKMTKVGGLSQSFIENWEEGQTVFHAWW